MTHKFNLTFKLLRNSKGINIGSVNASTTPKGKIKIQYFLEEMERVPNWFVIMLDKQLKTIIENFLKEDELEQTKYPFRYYEECSLDLAYVNAIS